MPGWDEASVDELLAEPIVRDLMAADRVDPGELRALLYGIQRTIDCYATTSGEPSSLVGFVERHGAIAATHTARPALPANRSRPDVRKSRTALADYSHLSTAPLGSSLCSQARCTARS
jgi:hypothetical protein